MLGSSHANPRPRSTRQMESRTNQQNRKTMKKLISALALVVCASCYGQNPAQKAIQVTKVIDGTIKEAASAVKDLGITFRESVYDPIRGHLWHDWAVCVFEDGFCLYNRFKEKRFENSGREVHDYFNYRGDGDSFFIDRNNCGRHVCLTQGPSALVQKHGPIVSILAINRPPTSWNESCQDGKAICP